MIMRRNVPSSVERGGFTLVEVLVAVAIIALLAGVVLVSLRGARGFAEAALVRNRLDDVSKALEIYKQRYGEYPPDVCASDAQIKRHILKRWPNALKSGRTDDMVAIARQYMDSAPGGTLLFWLAVMDGEGFFADDRDPISIVDSANEDEPRETPLIELTLDTDGKNGGNWNPDLGIMCNNMPVIYFRSEGKDADYYGMKEYPTAKFGDAAPYMNNGRWYNPDSFQLIYPGEDGTFGHCPFEDDDEWEGDHDHHDHHGEDMGIDHARDLKTKNGVELPDHDNITNFTDGATLDSQME